MDAAKKEIALGALLLRSLPKDQAEYLISHSVWKTYNRGATLFLQDEKSDSIHVVISGWVKLYRVSPSGNEAVVSVFARGESFGEALALRNLTYPVSAEAVTPCEIMHIPAQVLIEMIRRNPDAALSILASTFAHLHSLVAQLEQLKAQTGAQRVAEFLLELCTHESGDSCTVTLPYDKVLIAGRLGMKPESLSRAFSKLKPLGVKISGNHAEISDLQALHDYVELDPASSWNKGG